MVTALDAPVSVGRDEDERCDRGPLDDIRDDVCRLDGESPQAALLPGRDERPHRAVVGDGRPGGGEREPTALALEAAGDRPGGGRAAAVAARARKQEEPLSAIGADDGPRTATDGAARRNEEVEEHIDPTVRGSCARVCAGCAPNLCRWLRRAHPNRARDAVRRKPLLVAADEAPGAALAPEQIKAPPLERAEIAGRNAELLCDFAQLDAAPDASPAQLGSDADCRPVRFGRQRSVRGPFRPTWPWRRCRRAAAVRLPRAHRPRARGSVP